MKLLRFVIIKLSFCLSLGILIAYTIHIPLSISIYIVFGSLIALTITYFIAKHQFKKTIWFGILAYTTTICLGALLVSTHNHLHHTSHYSHINFEQNNPITFKIHKVLKPTTYHDKYIIDILKLNEHTVTGKMLLNIPKDTLNLALLIDYVYYTNSSIDSINAPLNPNQFNYKAYLQKQYINHQIYATKYSIFNIKSKTHTIHGYANHVRQVINNSLKLYLYDTDELAIINALFLGQRQDITKEVYSNYTNSGAIHILAVSGLHVGIILLIFNRLLKRIEYLKHGLLVKTILLLCILWSFAIIAGLTASVTRAVTMFSVVAISMNLKRPTNIYNTLAISAFILLLFKPLFLFDVGFQLSYCAVLGIVSIQPMLYNIWSPKFSVIGNLWKVFTVSIAAQVGVLPLSLYYFHQFPGLFIVSNLIIIPLLGAILSFGILVIILAVIGILPQFLSKAFSLTISYMNHLMEWVSNQKSFLITDISFNLSDVITSYIIIILIVQLIRHKTRLKIKFLLVSIIGIQLLYICLSMHSKTKHAFTIFYKSKHTIIGKSTYKTLTIYNDLDSLGISKNNMIKNYMIANKIEHMNTDTIPSIFDINSKTILVIDSLGLYQIKSFKPDYIILKSSPKINLNRLIKTLNPKLIIADGSNYKSYVKRWETTCNTHKLPFYDISKKGAFVLKY